MDDLRTAVLKTVTPYLDTIYDNPEELTEKLMELIDGSLFDARRAGARVMQQRCITLVREDGPYSGLAYKIERMPLKTIDEPAPPERPEAQAALRGGEAMTPKEFRWHQYWTRVARRKGMTRDQLIEHFGNGGTLDELEDVRRV